MIEMSCANSNYKFSLFFFKQKTAYEMRISDWSSDVCSSDLAAAQLGGHGAEIAIPGTPVAQHGALYAGRGGQRSGGQQIGLAREGWLTHGGFGGRHGGAAATAHRRLSWGGWGRWDRPVGANLGLWDLSVKSLFWIHWIGYANAWS